MQYTNYLPAEQIKRLTAAQRNVLHYVLKSFIYSDCDLDQFHAIPREFFLCGLSKRYYLHLKELVQMGILEVLKNPTNGKETYYKAANGKKGQCKKYRFNPAILSGLKKIAWQSEPMSKRAYMATPAEQQKIKQSNLLKWTAKQHQAITIVATDHEAEINAIVTSEFISDRYSELVEGNKDCFHYCMDGKMSQHPLPIKTITAIAEKMGKNALFCNKSRIVYIDNETELLANKEAAIKVIYSELMSNIENGNFFLDRSETNNRLTTTFAVFPNALLHLLRFRGERIKQLDIKNSQFCILSNLIYCFNEKQTIRPILSQLKTIRQGKYFEAFKASFNQLQTTDGDLRTDAKEFLRCCKNGELYEVIAKNCAISRSEAKQAMFIICFADYRYNPAIKNVVKCLFPSIIGFIDLVKKHLKELDFATMLQEIESFICIDNVLNELKTANIPALTKHDSFCVPEPIEPIATDVVKKCLSNLLPLGFTLKIEGNER